jgi:glycosyltransferase involved in cell wall biosynthesis
MKSAREITPANYPTILVIPALNESGKIGNLIQEAREAKFEVVCVDDGSADRTREVAKAKDAIVLSHCTNLGQGASLETGFQFVRNHPLEYEYVITFDADGQHAISDAIAILTKLVEQDLDLVIGSRFGSATSTNQVPVVKRWILKAYALFQAKLFGVQISDTHNGLRGFKSKLLDNFFLHNNGYAHADEFMILLRDPQIQWQEQSVTINYTKYSKVKGQSLFNGIVILIEKLWR